MFFLHFSDFFTPFFSSSWGPPHLFCSPQFFFTSYKATSLLRLQRNMHWLNYTTKSCNFIWGYNIRHRPAVIHTLWEIKKTAIQILFAHLSPNNVCIMFTRIILIVMRCLAIFISQSVCILLKVTFFSLWIIWWRGKWTLFV